MEENRAKIFEQRDQLLKELPKIPGFGRFLGGFDVNFVLAQFLSKPAEQGGVPDNAVAAAVARALVRNSKILTCYRGREPGCVGSLRIAVGTKEEVDDLLLQIRSILEEVYSDKVSVV